jgi:hypothetical protein
MSEELAPLLRGRAQVTIVDISADEELVQRYARRIPVLTAGEAELSCFRLDAERVENYLASAR